MKIFQTKKIKIAKSFGEKLKNARKRKSINLEQAEKETKISMKYLYDLEHSRYDQLPADVYVNGFLTRYADYLNLKKEEILKEYYEEKKIFDSVRSIKRHSDQENKNLIKPEPSKKWLETPKFFITPELVMSALAGICVMVLLGYIWFQVKSFAAAPPLEIVNEDAEIVVSMDYIDINGKTDTGANLIINGEAVSVESDGAFTQRIQLNKGVNTIEIVASNKANKETKKTIQVLSK